ncbi:MAG: MarR family transcriptional regulator [Bacteroidales bacterium]|nr:MarR family transcriptional regulator [Bacteroidales bacterium]
MSNLSEAISYLSDLVEKVLEESISQSDFSDLTQQQFHYLQVIVRMKNPNLTELAGELGITKPTVTVLVDKLVEKGYVSRVKSDEDRRTMHLHINKKGARINALREVAYNRMAEKIKSGLSETETAIFTELLKKLVKHS